MTARPNQNQQAIDSGNFCRINKHTEMESDFAVVKNTCENELEFGCVSSLVKCHSFHRYKTNSSLLFCI